MATQSTFSMTLHGRHEPFELQVGRGQIPYHSSVTIFGYNANVGTSPIPIWEQNSAYVYITTASTLNVASTTSDTANVTITGLDSSYNTISETITLNGTSNVVTTNTYYRVNSMITTAGNATGTVTAKQGTNVVIQMNPGIGKSQNSWYTVPANSTFYLTRAEVSTSLSYAGSVFNTYRVSANSATGTQLVVLQQPFVGNFIALRSIPFAYAAGTDIQFQVNSSTGTSAVGVVIEGYTILNQPTAQGY